MADTIKMYRGDRKVFTVTITDEAGAAVACDAATAIVMTCRSAVGGSSVFSVTLAAGDIVVGGAGNNVLTITILPAKTTAATADQAGSTYYADIEVTFAATNIQSFPRDSSGNPALLVIVLYGDMTT